ncbi:hypothetical protein INR49_024359 [Caranx melampygus]|nr:hypothetical protein INR49_024359 [Caranx melampygus]
MGKMKEYVGLERKRKLIIKRSWFQLSPAPFLTTPEHSPSGDMGGNEGGGGERWNFFGTRSVVQKSPTDPGSETSTDLIWLLTQ